MRRGDADLAKRSHGHAVEQLTKPISAEDAKRNDLEYFLHVARNAALDAKDWKQAAAILGKRVELEVDDRHRWYEWALTSLASGDMNGYRRACREMVKHFEGDIDSEVANRILYTCVLAPNAIDDLHRLTSFAELTLPSWEGNHRLLGAAAYRNGDYDAALRHFDTAEPIAGRRAWDWLFIAMAYERAEQHADAQDALGKAIAWAVTDGPGDNWGWTEQVETRHLLKEVRSLVGVE